MDEMYPPIKRSRVEAEFESQPGPSRPRPDKLSSGSSTNGSKPYFDNSDSDSDEEEKHFDREALIKDIDAEIRSLISRPAQESLEEKVYTNVKKEEDATATAAAVASNYRGKDGAMYTFEIFMRDKDTCRSKKDRPGKYDPRAPIIYDKNGVANAIIPANHKLMLLCTRIATHPRQYIKRGNYVLFKFYVDGEALSEGTLHEASLSKPEINFAKAYIDTHEVRDSQRVEHAQQANAYVGTFVVKVFTKLRETLVSEQYTAVPEDDKVLEKTKRRICCSVSNDDNIDVTSISNSNNSNKQVKRFSTPQAGLAESGLPAATIEISYDDLLGTRSRHFGDQQFSINNLRLAGVTEKMLKEAYPCGIPNTSYSGTVDLISDDEDEIKTEIKEEEE